MKEEARNTNFRIRADVLNLTEKEYTKLSHIWEKFNAEVDKIETKRSVVTQ